MNLLGPYLAGDGSRTFRLEGDDWSPKSDVSQLLDFEAAERMVEKYGMSARLPDAARHNHHTWGSLSGDM